MAIMIRSALDRWSEVTARADANEAEMHAAAATGVYHPLWAELKDANDTLTELAETCQTDEQRRNPLFESAEEYSLYCRSLLTGRS